MQGVFLIFFAGLDDEVSIFDTGVFTPIHRVVLFFVITYESFLVSPFCGVWCARFGELVLPDQFSCRLFGWYTLVRQ